MEQKKTRAQRWDEKFSKNLAIFPKRISNVLENYPFEYSDQPTESIYLWGKSGTGKTIRAAQMLLNWRRNNFIVMDTSKTDQFTTVSEFLMKIKSTFNSDSNVTESDIVETYANYDLLVLDDFGMEKVTDWSYQMLYILINRRYEHMKTTIFTSNFDLNQLADAIGDSRIPSRISEMCKVIELTKNYRH